jgi:hypothetical protein
MAGELSTGTVVVFVQLTVTSIDETTNTNPITIVFFDMIFFFNYGEQSVVIF